ncbi:MAG: hypothetical protein JSS04_06765, partial [Proteobacteria bacterium]|nr:hypothetical protein [Pseudomonadota bacterium]
MYKSILFLAGLGSAMAVSAPVLAGPDSAPRVAPSSTNSGNGNFGGTEIRREQQEAQAPANKQEEANE